MKRFEFRLQRILRLQDQIKKQAEMREQQLRAEVDRVRAESDRLEDELNGARAALESHVGGAVEAIELKQQYIDALEAGRNVVRVQHQLTHKQLQLEIAQEERRSASMESEALNQLREEAWKQHTLENSRREQVEIDDTAVRRWKGY